MDRPMTKNISEDRVCIEEAILQSLRPFNIYFVHKRKWAICNVYNQAHELLINSRHKECLARVREIKKVYHRIRKAEHRDILKHGEVMLWEATLYWKVNLIEMLIHPLSKVSPIIKNTRKMLPRGITLDHVISTAHNRVVPDVFREFVRLCDYYDTRPMWVFEPMDRDLLGLDAEGFLPVDWTIRAIRRSLRRTERKT
ncbi:MAG: hypothetical protein Q9216_001090 [Gyalolechia sp. 2 TL-2023]